MHISLFEELAMDQQLKEAIGLAVSRESYAQLLGIELVELDMGYSAVEMDYDPDRMNNIFARAHGGAIFALIDEAFETAGQTCGSVTVGLNVNVNYVASPEIGARLRANRELRHSGDRPGGAFAGELPGAGLSHGETASFPVKAAPARLLPSRAVPAR